MKKYLRLLRVHHYLKNALIFIPLIFSGQIFQWDLMVTTLSAFLSFSLVTSFVYIINDLRDIESDRLHPIKCKRPLASGEIAATRGYAVAIICLSCAIIIQWLLVGSQVDSLLLLLLYIVLNLLYSFGLKNVPIVDVFIIVAGFMIRVFYGASVGHILISAWLCLTIIFMSFYLALGKRRNELELQGDKGRKVLNFYNHSFLDKNMYMCLGLTITCYGLWCMDGPIRNAYSNSYRIATVPLVLLICMKYSLNIEKGSHGDPVDVVLGDNVLMGCIVIYMISVICILYAF